MNDISKYLICLFISIVLLVSTAVSPSLYAAENTVYIDYDGDGFSDSAPDSDNNGIPDEFQSNTQEITSPEATRQQLDQFFNSISITDKTLNLSLFDKFSLRKYNSCNIYKNRSVFDADFGTNVGLGTGLAGGACAGGICF